MPALMLQGTGSGVGKSLLAAGLCRVFADRGLSVLPFKPQNMSNNAAVTADGGEIGRAQALQALACRVEPHTDMNPVLLKPEAELRAQLVVHGHVRGTLHARDFQQARLPLLPDVLASFGRLRSRCDLIVVEGAGSPAETNLRHGDIANMGFARAAGVPVVLVGDIDRGGVIASIVGTRVVLDRGDASMIRGFIVNRFRGERALFDDGYRDIERRSGWPGLGVLPWMAAAARLPSEDSVAPSRSARVCGGGRVIVACPILPAISNADDLDPLRLEPSVDLVMVPPGTPLPADAALMVLPGSKATIADLAFLRRQEWDLDIRAHLRRGGAVLGLCGGYQMLGREIADPGGVEGRSCRAPGLGLLDVLTVLSPTKVLRHVRGVALGATVQGYEMHMGATAGPDAGRPFAQLDVGPDGAMSADGAVLGTYVHGLLASPGFRHALLSRLGWSGSGLDHAADVDSALDEVAATIEHHCDVDGLLRIAALAS